MLVFYFGNKGTKPKVKTFSTTTAVVTTATSAAIVSILVVIATVAYV
jgi:hypothetical protein